MARNQTGSVVSRAASTGGSRRYRGTQGPSNFILAMVLIVVLGFASVVWARADYQNRAAATTVSVPPAIGQQWYSGVASYVCGTEQAPFTKSTAAQSPSGLKALGNGVVSIMPTTSADAGAKATLGQFIEEWNTNRGVTPVTLVPGSLSIGGHTYADGDVCPKGTPDAGQKGVVRIARWTYSGYFANRFTAYTDPHKVKFANNAVISISFGPVEKSIPKPPVSLVSAVLNGGVAPNAKG